MQSASPPPLPAGVAFLERGWLSSNLLVFRGADEAAVLDTGYVSHAPQTLALVRHALQGQAPTRLLNTHLHSDHCGGNAALQSAYPSLRCLIPPGQADAVRRWDEDALTYRATGQRCPRFRCDDLLLPNTEVQLADRAWQVHAAPGHDPDAVLLFEPHSRTLISADALWENGFGVVFPELEGDDAFDQVAATLELIESLRPRLVAPGHGRLFGDVDAALARARSRLQRFVADPASHARHAAKVLIKFRLLDWQRTSRQAVWDWATVTPYVHTLHARLAAGQALHTWVDELLEELARAGAATLQGDQVLDA